MRQNTVFPASLVAVLSLVAASLLVFFWPWKLAEAAFPGQNGKIAYYAWFVEDDANGANEIFTMNPDGTNGTRLTNTSGTVQDAYPTFSPDGTKIAFASNGEIFVMNPDGTDQTRLTRTMAWDSLPAFSPDGTKIVFTSYVYNQDDTRDFEIYVMHADGRNQTRLTTRTGWDGAPAFSPDGTKIAFARANPFSNPDIFVMDAVDRDGDGNGDNPTNLINDTTPGSMDESPDWSPDGTKIIFARGGTVHVMDADGSDRTSLGVGGSDPAWSPDGTKIAFTSSNSGVFPGINVMNADGSDPVRIQGDSSQGYDPDWGPMDIVAPKVTGVKPRNSATGVSRGANAVATFSEAMDKDTINGATFALAKRGNTTPVAATVTYEAEARKAILNPKRDLRFGSTYIATVMGGQSGAKDFAGNALENNKVWSFKVRER